jgi:hypothetical protein
MNLSFPFKVQPKRGFFWLHNQAIFLSFRNFKLLDLYTKKIDVKEK